MEKTPTARRLVDIVRALCLVSGSPHFDKALMWLDEYLANNTFSGHEVSKSGEPLVHMLSDAMSGSLLPYPYSNEQFKEHDRATREIGEVLQKLVYKSPNAFSYIEDCLKITHRCGLSAILTALTQMEDEGRPQRNEKGECLLHNAWLMTHKEFQFMEKADPSIRFHANWFTLHRPHDGATPLHVLWDPTHGGPVRVKNKAQRGGPEQWRAYQHHASTIEQTRFLVERGALLTACDHNGVSVMDLIIQARDDGFWDWQPNEAGMSWMDPVLLDCERRIIEKATKQASAQTVRARL